jgi:serine/threonine-protein kinase
MDPRRLGGYELREVLGEGGMGTVYRAHDPTLDRPAAIKVIRAKTLSAEGKERFLREARASSKIGHPNIVTIYAAGEENGEPYMAMELIDGKTLRHVIDEGGIDWRVATRWIVQLLDALQRLHAEGIVHRDLKPENVMITKDGTLKLMDFGLAHLTTQTAITQEGTTLGTVPYMSPEQVLGRKLDARSDLFSVATIYHELLTFETKRPSLSSCNPPTAPSPCRRCSIRPSRRKSISATPTPPRFVTPSSKSFPS